MRAHRLAFVLAVLGLGVSPVAQSWGKFGHLTVCDLAYRNLTPDARVALQTLMRSHSGGILVKGKGNVPDRTYTSFNVGCLEEDEVPRKHPSDHFINIDRSTTAIHEACPNGTECILAGIQRDFGILKDAGRTDEERVFSLMSLGHWIGDIHQPLHISFADDRGGNWIKVQMQARCGTSGYRPDSLHAVWDNCLLEARMFERVRQRVDFKTTWGRRTITYRAVDTLLANTSLAEEKSFLGADARAWADESYQVTLQPDVKYCVKEGSECHYSTTQPTLDSQDNQRTQPINAAYLTAFGAVAEDRVRRAGFRLADLINQALDPNYAGPVADAPQRE
ncbi:S1/P1 nuclease [Tahibacter amnicola]|uniref:S1/P1 nuclease n=1 Tax=Tahibacter amnicola TaxID=2976241 RepID=A0ABY6BIC9_9GAMM|nr:S1/P1 nuclease [Tahibacter amnicola]UXI69771.1 S1/P1 nuclease [Tahibacter amnicola]